MEGDTTVAIALGAAVLTKIEDPAVRELAIRNALTVATQTAKPSAAAHVDAEDIREQKLATIVAPDNGTPHEVLSAVLECAKAWAPEARIIGNVRAGDIARAIEATSAPAPNAGLPQDVINLVIAAREAFDTGHLPDDENHALDKALESFASKVRYANEPDDEAALKSEGSE